MHFIERKFIFRLNLNEICPRGYTVDIVDLDDDQQAFIEHIP